MSSWGGSHPAGPIRYLIGREMTRRSFAALTSIVFVGCGRPARRSILAGLSAKGIRVAFATIGRVNTLDSEYTGAYKSVAFPELLGVYQSLPKSNELLAHAIGGAKLIPLGGGQGKSVPVGARAEAAVSDDGRNLAWVAEEAGTRFIACTIGSGSAVREVYKFKESSRQARNGLAWSPDGARLAFSAHDKAYIADVSRGTVTQFASGSQPAWSTDGELISLRLPDGVLGLIAATPPWKCRRVDAVRPLRVSQWSPDGTCLLFTHRQHTPKVLVPPCFSTTGVAIYRLADGAVDDIFPLCMGGEGGEFFWVVSQEGGR